MLISIIPLFICLHECISNLFTTPSYILIYILHHRHTYIQPFPNHAIFVTVTFSKKERKKTEIKVENNEEFSVIFIQLYFRSIRFI